MKKRPVTLGVLWETNAVFNVSHRSNGRLVSNYEMKDFLECIAEAKLITPRSVGHWHSWHNKAHGAARITSRIDHGFVNDARLNWNENTVLQYLNHYLSDHTPLVCQFGKCDLAKGRPFRFLNYLADHPDFLSTVEIVWNSNHQGNPMQRV